MAEQMTSLQACKQHLSKQDYGRIMPGSVDDTGMNHFILTNMGGYKAHDIACMLSTGDM